MKDKHKGKHRDERQAQQQVQAKEQLPTISRRGKKVIGAGIGLLIIGYLVLARTDPAGQNWASILSPFLILGGYAVIGIGIVLPDPGENTAAATPGAQPGNQQR